MLKILTRSCMYFLRRNNKTPQIRETSELSKEDEEEESKPYSLRSEYQEIKNLIQDSDKDGDKDQNDQEMRLTAQFMKNMLKQNLKKQKPKQKPNIKDKLRSLETPQYLLSQNISQANKPAQQSKLLQQITKQTGSTIEDEQLKYKRLLKQAKQELMINEIMKKTKYKQLKLQKDDNIDEGINEKKLILRRQKILKSLQGNNDPSQGKFDITTNDLLAMKYSPQILAKAHQYKNKQLAYFKQLIIHEQNSRLPLHRRRTQDGKDIQQQQQLQEIKQVEIQNLYKNIKQQQGIKLFEDDNFYRQKAIRQIKQKQNLNIDDIKLKQQLQKDIKLGDKYSNIFMDQILYHQQGKIQKYIQYRDTSFYKQQKSIQKLSTKMTQLGVEFDPIEIKQLSKKLIFQQKKYLQQQLGFQKYLHKKQKLKNMKKQLKQIHKSVLKDNINFNKQQQPSITISQLKNIKDPTILQENLQKLQQYYNKKQSVLITKSPQDIRSQIYKKKTFKNIENFISLYFSNGLLNHNNNQLDDIDILQIIPNKSNTVINIFWNISSSYLQKYNIIQGQNQYQKLIQKIKNQFENRLKNQSNYISGKMTQLLRLRYGPDIRFHFDIKTNKTEAAIDQLSKYTKEIAMVELEQYQKKGLIKTQQESLEYYEKLVDVARRKIFDYNSRKQLLSKKYRKMQQKPQKQANSNPKPNTQKTKKQKKKKPYILKQDDSAQHLNKPNQDIKSEKKKPSQKFWDSIDLL